MNKAALYYFYLYYVLYYVLLIYWGLSDIMCELFVVINYITDNNVNLPWVAWAIVFKLSLDLGGSFGLLLPLYWAVIAVR